jgi:hypothetical protein
VILIGFDVVAGRGLKERKCMVAVEVCGAHVKGLK